MEKYKRDERLLSEKKTTMRCSVLPQKNANAKKGRLFFRFTFFVFRCNWIIRFFFSLSLSLHLVISQRMKSWRKRKLIEMSCLLFRFQTIILFFCYLPLFVCFPGKKLLKESKILSLVFLTLYWLLVMLSLFLNLGWTKPCLIWFD